jgi:hypothetical protein
MLDCVQSFNILIYSALIFNLLANEVIPLPVIYLQSINGKIRIKNTGQLEGEAFSFL